MPETSDSLKFQTLLRVWFTERRRFRYSPTRQLVAQNWHDRYDIRKQV